MEKLSTKPGRSLSEMIDQIVRESIKSKLHNNAVEEKEKQTKLVGEEDSEEQEAGTTGEKTPEPPSKTVDAEKEKLKKGEIAPKDIVDKLNTIRSGKSFKDSAISSKMDEYINSLSKEEKTALLAFLKGLAQIVTGEIEADQAQDPSENPADIEMKKTSGPEKKSIKPNVIKAPEKEKIEKKPSSEDTSGPVPIMPKKK